MTILEYLKRKLKLDFYQNSEDPIVVFLDQ